MSNQSTFTRRHALATGAAVLLGGRAALAADTKPDVVRIGKAVVTSFPFSAIDVGEAAGIWKSLNLDVQSSAFKGDAQVQEAFAAGQIDFGLGSGPSMAYRAKGVPAIAVAVIAGRPLDMALVVAKGGPIKTLGDMKGKSIGVTTAGSLTDWVARQVAVDQGWGPDGVTVEPLGSQEARLAALTSGQIAGSVNDTTEAYEIEGVGKGTVLKLFGDIVHTYITHVIFASNDMVAKNPDVVHRFVKGWFMTVAYMRKNKDVTVQIVAKTMGVDPAAVEKSYAANMIMMTGDGTFLPAAVDAVIKSVHDTGIYAGPLDPASLYSTKFVPVTVS